MRDTKISHQHPPTLLSIHLFVSISRSLAACEIRQDCVFIFVIKPSIDIISSNITTQSHKEAAKKYNNCAFGKVIHTQNFDSYSILCARPCTCTPFQSKKAFILFSFMKKSEHHFIAWLHEYRNPDFRKNLPLIRHICKFFS